MIKRRITLSRQVMVILRMTYTPVFSNPRVDVGGAYFSMGTPSRNDCISAYCMNFFVHVA